ncbi:MAG TPA: FixH family protein [Myxococcota bacterium]|nr:FixH family protein [Myxococcota bacterium]
MQRYPVFASIAALVALACAHGSPAPAQQSADRPGWSTRSDSGRLVGHLAPEPGTVEIGKFQTWILELREARGAAVTGADIAIAGGMPGHGHGLPSQPQVTEEIGDGRYRIEGVKLNMVGAWVIEVFVQTAAGRDRLRFDLAIDY